SDCNFSSVPTSGLPAHRALTGCVLALLIIWTLLGNFTVCAAVSRYRHLRAKVTNIFIVSLALSDLLVAVLVMPWKAVAEVAGFWPFGSFCKTWLACDIMCSTASILNLCVISVDRYWAISNPFRYERSMNKKVAFVMIGMTWTVSLVISFVPVQLDWHRAEIGDLSGQGLMPLGKSADGSCDSSLSRTYAISSSLISFYIPVLIMIITYTRIYRIAQTQIRVISSLERAAEHSRISLHPDSPFSIRKETKVLKTLSIIMGVFVCCWLPFFILNCAQPFCPGPRAPGAHRGPYCVSEKTFDVFVWIGWSNSSLNPVIYAFNADFRDAFLRLLRCRGRGFLAVVSAAPDIVVVDKEQRKAVVVDAAVPSDGNIRKKDHEELEKYQGLREELEKAWKVKVTVVPVVIGALRAVTPKLEEWLQQKDLRPLSPEKRSSRNS
uniref:D(1B) dopamine receptor n=1 Tax=Oryzias latipes TaxID=8090 RepID=A0A3P9LU28_ORYLA